MERAGAFNNPQTAAAAAAAIPEQSVQNSIDASATLHQPLAELSAEGLPFLLGEACDTTCVTLFSGINKTDELMSQQRDQFVDRSGNQSVNADPWMPPIPVHVVTHAAELPVSFLQPNPSQQLVIGFDCEGVELARYGRLCVMQLAFKEAVYLVDAVVGGAALMQACKLGLESRFVRKVCHDCKRDSEALYFQFNIRLNNVFDSQIAYNLLEEQHGEILKPDHISFVNLLADRRYCGVHYGEKEEVRKQLRKDPQFWTRRPWTEMMKRVAAEDVRFLLHIYERMSVSLTKLSKWRLSVRSSLYCRCFCSVDANFQAWHVPPFSGEVVDGTHPGYEILAVIDVPHGKMGRVIGIQGESIRHIKKSFRCDIFIERQRGPPDKARLTDIIDPKFVQIISSYDNFINEYEIFLIGTADEVVKAKKLLDTMVGRAPDTTTSNPSYRNTVTSNPSYRNTVTSNPSYRNTVTSNPSYRNTVTSNPSYPETMTSRPAVTLGPSPNRGIKIIDPQTGTEIQIQRREENPK